MHAIIFVILTTILLGGCSAPDEPNVSLYLAVQRRDINQIERHIYWGTDLNQVDPNGNRAIHVAAERGYIIIIRRLLQNGVPVDSVNEAGKSPIYYAILSGRTQVADLLLHHGAELDASKLLLAAAQQDNTDRDVVGYLMAHKADTEITDEQGNTPLLVAIQRGNHRLTRHLVSHGADVNAANQNGASALILAEGAGYRDIVDLLKRQGAR